MPTSPDLNTARTRALARPSARTALSAPAASFPRRPLSPIQPPARCPFCDSAKVTPKGARFKKLEVLPLTKCHSCGRTFARGPRALRNKTYPAHEIIEAITVFNMGYTLHETALKLASRHGHRVNPSTISRWLSEHPDVTAYRHHRDLGRARFHPDNLIRRTKLYHAQVYDYAHHRGKLAALRDGSLFRSHDPHDDAPHTGPTALAAGAAHHPDAESPTTTPFAAPRTPERAPLSGHQRHALANFLETANRRCPHALFRNDNGHRGSSLPPGFLNRDALEVHEIPNLATEAAALIIPTVGSNIQRHPRLQRFMLANDATTLAVEVPVWLTNDDILALEARHRVTLLPHIPPHPDRCITGHIDMLQTDARGIAILDYKPDARTAKPIAQLTIYALALTALVPAIKLEDVRCAWFNETCYNEFRPADLIPAR